MTAEAEAPVARILVIAVDRLGDLLQSCATMHALRTRFPAAQIDLLAIAKFAESLEGSPFHDRVFGLTAEDVQAFGRAAEASLDGGSVANAGLAELAEILAGERYDLVVNLVTSTLGAWLTTVANPRFNVGLYVAPDRALLVEGASLRYFVALLDFRDENPFNLVDLFRASVAEPRGVVAPAVFVAKQPSFLLPLGPDVVALNPGASQADRRWNLSSFAALADALVADGLRVFLVGSPSDEALCEAVRQASTSKPVAYTNLTVPEMAGWFASIGCVVANDTGAMHVAAAAGAKAVGVYGGFSRYRETAPFASGQMLLEAEELGGVDVASVRLAVLLALGRVDEAAARAHWCARPIEVARTRLDDDRPEVLGGVRYEVLADRSGDGDDAVRCRLVRALAECTYARAWIGRAPTPAELEAAAAPCGASEARGDAGDALVRWAEALETTAGRWRGATADGTATDDQITVLLKVEAMNVAQILGDGIAILPKLLEWDLKMVVFADGASFGEARATLLEGAARTARTWADAMRAVPRPQRDDAS